MKSKERRVEKAEKIFFFAFIKSIIMNDIATLAKNKGQILGFTNNIAIGDQVRARNNPNREIEAVWSEENWNYGNPLGDNFLKSQGLIKTKSKYRGSGNPILKPSLPRFKISKPRSTLHSFDYPVIPNTVLTDGTVVTAKDAKLLSRNMREYYSSTKEPRLVNFSVEEPRLVNFSEEDNSRASKELEAMEKHYYVPKSVDNTEDIVESSVDNLYTDETLSLSKNAYDSTNTSNFLDQGYTPEELRMLRGGYSTENTSSGTSGEKVGLLSTPTTLYNFGDTDNTSPSCTVIDRYTGYYFGCPEGTKAVGYQPGMNTENYHVKCCPFKNSNESHLPAGPAMTQHYDYNTSLVCGNNTSLNSLCTESGGNGCSQGRPDVLMCSGLSSNDVYDKSEYQIDPATDCLQVPMDDVTNKMYTCPDGYQVAGYQQRSSSGKNFLQCCKPQEASTYTFYKNNIKNNPENCCFDGYNTGSQGDAVCNYLGFKTGSPNCTSTVRDYCRKNMTDQRCKAYCSVRSNNCDDIITDYCASNPSSSETICGCFHSDEFYLNYANQLSERVPGLISTTYDPGCIYPPCSASSLKKFTFRQGATCPSIQQCIQSVNVDNKGNINGSIDVNNSVNCTNLAVSCSSNSQCGKDQICLSGACSKAAAPGAIDTPVVESTFEWSFSNILGFILKSLFSLNQIKTSSVSLAIFIVFYLSLAVISYIVVRKLLK